jgi:multimeric flavodoxin WrbA
MKLGTIVKKVAGLEGCIACEHNRDGKCYLKYCDYEPVHIVGVNC